MASHRLRFAIATTNRFLPGNHVVLTDRATQCLTSFSLDFERRSTANVPIGPDMTVNSVVVNGQPAAFSFAQPTYPGDPNGPSDPNPLAREASQNDPVGRPGHNPLPPACSPELKSTSFAKRNSQNGQQCPANKLVIMPSAPVADGSRYQQFRSVLWPVARHCLPGGRRCQPAADHRAAPGRAGPGFYGPGGCTR
jgi:hypothetical protein